MKFHWLWVAMLYHDWKVLGIVFYPPNCGLYYNNLFFLIAAHSAEEISTCLISNVKQITCWLWNCETGRQMWNWAKKGLVGDVYLSSSFGRKIWEVPLQQITWLWLEDLKKILAFLWRTEDNYFLILENPQFHCEFLIRMSTRFNIS